MSTVSALRKERRHSRLQLWPLFLRPERQIQTQCVSVTLCAAHHFSRGPIHVFKRVSNKGCDYSAFKH